MRTVDLTAAKRAAEAIADYEASHPGKSFDKTERMKIISGYGLKAIYSELPDRMIAARELGAMEFPEENQEDSTQRLGQALTAFEQMAASGIIRMRSRGSCGASIYQMRVSMRI